jgi:hypothetical protein
MLHITTFLRLARQYANLGTAVQDQLDSLAENGEVTDENPNALKMCKNLVRSLNNYGFEDADVVLAAITKIQKHENLSG